MPQESITSASNTRLKQVRNLLQYGKRRRTESRFVLEGVRLVEDALHASAQPDYILIRDGVIDTNARIAEIVSALDAQDIPCIPVDTSLFNELSDTGHSQGILGIFPIPELSIMENASFLLALDGIANPGNLGTIMRSAAAAGVEGILLTHSSVDPLNPKVVRAGMGAHFRIPIVRVDWSTIRNMGLRVVLADAGGDETIYSIDWTTPSILVVGSEAHGFSEAAYTSADMTVSIPMKTGESLNAAMAATVIIYESYRQRIHR